MAKDCSTSIILWTKQSHWSLQALSPGLDLNLSCYILILNSSEKLLSVQVVEHQDRTLSWALKAPEEQYFTCNQQQAYKRMFGETSLTEDFSALAKIKLTQVLSLKHTKYTVYERFSAWMSAYMLCLSPHLLLVFVLLKCHCISCQQTSKKNKWRKETPTNYKIPYINGSLISDTNFQMHYLKQEITLSFSLHPDLRLTGCFF